MLELQNVTFRYTRQDQPALRNVTCQFGEQECVLIAGASGSGKTTLARVLGGFIPQLIPGDFQGQYRINNEMAIDLPTAEISSDVGLVQQDPESQFVTMYVIDEVAFGPENLCLSRETIQERVDASLFAVGVSYLLDRDLYELSGGEQQKVAMASIFSMNPKILVLDEPSAHLDRPSLKRLLITLQDLRKQQRCGLIIIDHQILEFLAIADRLLIMNQGSIDLTIPTSDVQSHSEALHQLGVVRKRRNFQERCQSHYSSEHSTLLEVCNLGVCYNGTRVLDSVSFQCNPGEIIGMMGPNGSGKTTLFLSLLGLRKIHEGTIFINGFPASNSVTERARQIGIVFQNPDHQLFERTVFDELLLAPKSFGIDLEGVVPRAEEFLEHTNLSEYRDRPPFGLSYGEKKRLTLIASEVYQPSLLLLDEPFAGQDARTAETLLNLLRLVRESRRGIVIVSHRPELLFDICDRIIYLENGRIKLDVAISDAQERLQSIAPDYVSDERTGRWQ